VAAIMAVAAFAYVAFEVLAAGQGGAALVGGRIERARLAAAADAGLNIAIHGLATDDRAVRWTIDGRSHDIEFDGVNLNIVVQDERGKAPLIGLNDGQARALFEGAGATGERLDALVTEFREWQTQEEAVRDPSAPPPERAIRHGPFATVGELAGLQDMDPALLSRIAPAVTVFFEESGPFEPSHASALAKAAMSADENPQAQDADAEAQAAEIASERPEIDIASDGSLIGRTLTVQVTARARNGERIERSAIVEMTGDKVTPYFIRYVE
jgi:type II secretory pathway component PulK